MRLISPTDSMFLLTESREHPMHVGGLQLFKPPDGAGPQFVREAYEAMIAIQEVQPTFRKHPAKILGGITNVAWSFDDDIDLDYHLRRSALPSPGRVRELLELTSRLHTSLTGTVRSGRRIWWRVSTTDGSLCTSSFITR